MTAILSVIGVLFAGAAQAANLTQPGDSPRVEELVVVAPRTREEAGHIQSPIVILNEDELRAYGMTSISDLLDAIAPLTGSGSGSGDSDPIFLVNGARLANLNELSGYPPEAISRVEILPETAALQYGFSPNQRVVNFVLKKRFSARSLGLEVSSPQQGGGARYDQAKAALVEIDNDKRFSISLEARQTTQLTEAQRMVPQVDGSVPSPGDGPDPDTYRDLVGKGSEQSINASWTRPVGVGANSGTISIEGDASHSGSSRFTGLDTLAEAGVVHTFLPALATSMRADALHLTLSLNQAVGDWRFLATLDGGLKSNATSTSSTASISEMRSAAANGSSTLGSHGGSIEATSLSDTIASLVSLTGRPVRLPAGPLLVAAKAGFSWSAERSANASPDGGTAKLGRGDASIEVNLGIPLTEARQGLGRAIGEIRLDASAGGDQLSDRGWLATLRGGAAWSPIHDLSLQANYAAIQAAPSLGDLGNPQIRTLNTPIYDFRTGRTSLSTIVIGGNDDLQNSQSHTLNIRATWRPFRMQNTSLSFEYSSTGEKKQVAPFPLLTPELEAAFPGRVVRDDSGAITAIVETPINLASRHESSLRWSFEAFGMIARSAAESGSSGSSGAWNLTISQTIQLSDEVRIGPGSVPSNLLTNGLLGSVPRQRVEIRAGGFIHGVGLSTSGIWTGPSLVSSSLSGAGASSLKFGAMAKVSLRAFVDLNSQVLPGSIFMRSKGARISLFINNVFGVRQKVTDGAGATPLQYSPFREDPFGRVFGIELRGLF